MKKNNTNQLLEKIISRLDKHDGNFEKIISRLDKHDGNFDNINKNFKRLENKIIKKLNFVVDHFDEENIKTNDRIEKLEKRVDTFAAPS